MAPARFTPNPETRFDEMGKRAVKSRRSAVFLDRDGVLNRAIVRNGLPLSPSKPEELELLPDVAEACDLLKTNGFFLVVVTNQPEVGRGTVDRKSVEKINAKISEALPIDRIEVCYDCDDSSEYRKPNPGMLRRAAQALDIDLEQSFMVGDRWRDVDCGHAAGCRTIFIDHGYAEPLRKSPDHRAKNLLEAARLIVDLAASVPTA
jgi:D-glycero-D-manno-heptose 1,7-bisphosphate phosphatase